ncbi:MAG: porin family protein [Rhizobiaceae bacterium]|nr:porin family protein [Rhizobiaceae bacterium]
MKTPFAHRTAPVLAALALLVAGSSAALAADAVVADIPAPAEQPAPVFSWTGLYLGGNVGWAGGGRDRIGLFAPGYVGSYGDVGPSGVFGGAQIGYNWQLNNWVVGLEADIQFSGADETVVAADGARTVTTESDVRWFGTIRPRLGYAFGPENRLLVYGTGGLAYGQVRYSITSTAPASTATNKDTYTGYTVGGGAEYAFTDNWTGRLEYQYVNFGQQAVSNGVITTFATPNFHTVRIGLNYKF